MLATTVSVPSIRDTVAISLMAGTSIVFIGANGAGKTRLGVHIERHVAQDVEVHRIAAQRALGFNDHVQPPNLEIATNRLWYGNDQASGKMFHRWGNKPATAMVSDFDHLLGALYAEENHVSVVYRQAALKDRTVPVPRTKFDRLTEIWHSLLPHRQLVVKESTVRPRDNNLNAEEYAASEMSDGERVIFYLLGQCILAAVNSVIIVDEPELHINRAILSRLWDEMESVRSDCAFLYITHDVEFAASRHAATKYALRAYSHNEPNPAWDIQLIPEADGLPDDVLSLVVGSRKPVLFVEGDGGSLDCALYRRIYAGYTIIPVGSCEQVVHTVATFARRTELHRFGCAGLVDFDSRSDAELTRLENGGVYTLPVSEVENLLLLPDVFLALAAAQKFEKTEAQAKLISLRQYIFKVARKEMENVALRATRRRIDAEVKRIGLEAGDIAALEAEFGAAVGSVKTREIYDSYLAAFTAALDRDDYAQILRLYDNKGLLSEAAKLLGMSKRSLEEFVLRALRGAGNEVLLSALTASLPPVATRPPSSS